MKSFLSILLLSVAFALLGLITAFASEHSELYEYPLPAGSSGDHSRFIPGLSLVDQMNPASSGSRSGPNHVRTSYIGSTLWTGMEDVAVDSNYAYCGLLNGLMIIDISDIPNPTLLSQLDLPDGEVRGVTKSGNQLYVADGTGGLKIVDVSNPAVPQLLGSVDEPWGGYASDIEISGTIAYLANGYDGLIVVDVGNPATPVTVGRYDTPDFAWSVKISGNQAFVADRYGGMLIIDISTPSLPVLLGSTIAGVETYYSGYIGVGVRGNFAYAACGDTCRVFDVSNPSSPTQVAYLPYGDFFSDFAFRDVYQDEWHAVLLYTVGEYEYNIYDVTDPLNPFVSNLGYGPNNDCFYHLALTPEYKFIPCDFSGLWILPGAYFEDAVGTYHIPGYIRDIDVQGTRMYVLSPDEGAVRILDVSNPTAPNLLGAFQLTGPYMDIERYAFSADKMCLVRHDGIRDTLVIVDASNPGNMPYYPYPVSDYLAAVAIKGNRLYLSEYSTSRFRIMDISDLEAMTEICRFQSAGSYSMCFTVENDLTYLCTSLGLEILNTSDPSNIVQVGTCPILLDIPWEIKIRDGRAYIVGYGGCQVVDVSNPASPVTLAVRAEPFMPGTIDISSDGNFAYLCEYGSQGLGIYSTRSAVPMNLAGRYKPRGFATRAIPIGDLLYVSEEYSVTILQPEMSTCGDPNGDGGIDISDPVYLISYIFAGGPAPVAGENSDVDCSGSIDISDVVFLIGFIFGTGLQPCAACKSS